MINDIKQLSAEKKQHLIGVCIGTVLVLAGIYWFPIRSVKADLAGFRRASPRRIKNRRRR